MDAAAEHRRRLVLVDDLAQLLIDALPKSSDSFAKLYVSGILVQFRSFLKSLVSLLSGGFVTEAWIVGRSMAECIIRVSGRIDARVMPIGRLLTRSALIVRVYRRCVVGIVRGSCPCLMSALPNLVLTCRKRVGIGIEAG